MESAKLPAGINNNSQHSRSAANTCGDTMANTNHIHSQASSETTTPMPRYQEDKTDSGSSVGGGESDMAYTPISDLAPRDSSAKSRLDNHPCEFMDQGEHQQDKLQQPIQQDASSLETQSGYRTKQGWTSINPPNQGPAIYSSAKDHIKYDADICSPEGLSTEKAMDDHLFDPQYYLRRSEPPRSTTPGWWTYQAEYEGTDSEEENAELDDQDVVEDGENEGNGFDNFSPRISTFEKVKERYEWLPKHGTPKVADTRTKRPGSQDTPGGNYMTPPGKTNPSRLVTSGNVGATTLSITRQASISGQTTNSDFNEENNLGAELWELLDDDGESLRVGTPAPNKLVIRLRNKQSNEVQEYKYLKLPGDQVDWMDSQQVGLISKWRRQIFRRKGFQKKKLNVLYAPIEDAWLELVFQKVKAVIENGTPVKPPTSNLVCPEFNKFFEGRVVQDSYGRDQPSREARDISSIKYKFARKGSSLNQLREEIKASIEDKYPKHSYMPVISEEELQKWRDEGYVTLDDPNDPAKNTVLSESEAGPSCNNIAEPTKESRISLSNSATSAQNNVALDQ